MLSLCFVFGEYHFFFSLFLFSPPATLFYFIFLSSNLEKFRNLRKQKAIPPVFPVSTVPRCASVFLSYWSPVPYPPSLTHPKCNEPANTQSLSLSVPLQFSGYVYHHWEDHCFTSLQINMQVDRAVKLWSVFRKICIRQILRPMHDITYTTRRLVNRRI